MSDGSQPADLPLHQHYTREGPVDCHEADCDVYQIQARARQDATRDTPARGDAHVFAWDYRQQPPMGDIAGAVMALSEHSRRVWMRELENGTDEYVWIVAGHEVSDAEAWKLRTGDDDDR